MRPFILEICCFNLSSVIVATGAGADRIELCMDPGDGGTTPSYGLIHTAREVTRNAHRTAPEVTRNAGRAAPGQRPSAAPAPGTGPAPAPVRLYPIIRPRGGDFFYDKNDYAQMLLDIGICRELGCDGVVIGGLTQDGRVDKEQCARLVEAAGPMGVTFHRAFDRVADPLDALEDIIAIGCERILTSGLRPTAPEGAALIHTLVTKAGDRIKIMPGSGVRAENLVALQATTGAREFHTSARVPMPSLMQYVNPQMQEQLTLVAVHSEEVRQMRTLLDDLYNSEAR
ncbi:copper homeostasis protein CutC [Dinghuibacter silviterrae]|uniref:PF03932 family protein CutC n=1 Tax=Dinghuibacter silviterrae TaxID=1539049 RepID=A0A4R8DIF5_9BACT|nr:copper homeostasis protein CutC [Dinghuibacter silviterrae]TDW97529.1 copper homeostasis protein [Dinghuibacter silviterrae]